MSKTYTSKDIKVMDEIEHIRLNSGMYIGETTNPVHLIEECLDNALDEAIAEYAKIIAININTKNNTFCVIDDGRGMPFDNDIAITIATKMFSGGKFKGSKTAYEVSAGKHGIGLVAVNALSENFTIEIYRDNKHAKYIFQNAILKEKIIENFKDKKPFSTKIQFNPSKKYFESLIPNIDKLRKRLLISSAEIPNCTFILNMDKKREIIKLSKGEFFKSYCMTDVDKETSPVINIVSTDDKEKFDITFGYSFDGPITPKVISSVNLLPVESGGTHINLFFDMVKDIFTTKGKKLNLKFTPQDCLCGLRVYFSLYLKEPELSGQVKDKLINRKEYFDKLVVKLRNQLDSYFNNNSEVLESMLNFFVEIRRKVDSKKVKSETHGRRSSTKFTKLRDCSGIHGELYVVEGDSAGGGFIDCRDAKRHAIMPLKGKIPSIANKEDILKNNEIKEFIQALGCGVGPAFDISKLRYNKVICGVDPDADGGHIFCLLTIALAALAPDVIKKGHYYLVQVPHYALIHGKEFTPLWTAEEVTKSKSHKGQVILVKGLGQLNPDQLKVCCLDEKTRRLIKVVYTSDLKEIMELFTNVNKKRELLNGELNG
jgi:DNA gyrase/topoisomerase IV subunit B